MSSSFRSALPQPLSCIALLAALATFAPDSPAPASRDVSEPALAGIHVQRGRRRFTSEDIPAVVSAMRRAGHIHFVVSLDPNTGAITVEDGNTLTPHFDIKPGECPNNIEIEGITSFRTGVLGNAFDVTGIDTGSLRLSNDLFFGEGESDVEPINTFFADQGTPFVAELCDCTTAGGDDVTDLIAEFDRDEVIDVFDLDQYPTGSHVPLRISGVAGEGRQIFSSRDCVKITNHSPSK